MKIINQAIIQQQLEKNLKEHKISSYFFFFVNKNC